MFSSAASIPSNKGRTPVFIFAETFCLEGNKEISGEDYFCGSWFSFENCHEKILREMVQIQGLESGIIYVNFSLIIIYLNEIFILFLNIVLLRTKIRTCFKNLFNSFFLKVKEKKKKRNENEIIETPSIFFKHKSTK